MERQKVIGDWVLATRDTMFVLQTLVGRLERWQSLDQVETDEFEAVCRQLKESGLWGWAGQAGGHGIKALAEAVGTRPEIELERRRPDKAG